MESNQNSVLGTRFKLNVHMPPTDGAHLSNVDWTATVFVKSGYKKLEISKQDAIYIDDDNYVIRVDSSLVGAGDYYLTLTANIPDPDFDDGIRVERKTIPTGVHIDPI